MYADLHTGTSRKISIPKRPVKFSMGGRRILRVAARMTMTVEIITKKLGMEGFSFLLHPRSRKEKF